MFVCVCVCVNLWVGDYPCVSLSVGVCQCQCLRETAGQGQHASISNNLSDNTHTHTHSEMGYIKKRRPKVSCCRRGQNLSGVNFENTHTQAHTLMLIDANKTHYCRYIDKQWMSHTKTQTNMLGNILWMLHFYICETNKFIKSKRNAKHIWILTYVHPIIYYFFTCFLCFPESNPTFYFNQYHNYLLYKLDCY